VLVVALAAQWLRASPVNSFRARLIAMTEHQFNIVLFHLRAMLGLICLQAGILLGFAVKYL
jgi:hypothetical protein